MAKRASQDTPQKQDDKTSAPPFDSDWYEENRSEIAVIMGCFFLRHLNLLYREFKGDFVLCLVLGEIAHHNISGFFSTQGTCLKIQKQFATYPDRMRHLKPANAFSISEATGIPRETVRRKIDKLQKKGWIIKNDRSEVVICETVSDHFTKEFNKEILAELFETDNRCDAGRALAVA